MQVGIGPIGQRVVSYMRERQGIEIVAAVDLAPEKVGKDLGRICGLDTDIGVIVSDDLDSAVADTRPDVAVLTTVSSFPACAAQAAEIAKLGVHVVSTCEEMSHPWDTAPDVARQLDETARTHDVAVLGTGVNPGFLMDYLPTAMTAVCQDVTSIKVSRHQDATFRRIPFQQKIGAGLTLEEFEAKKQTGELRHVGLTESIQMIAASLGWKLDKTEDIISPVIAETDVTTGYTPIQAGMAAGVKQIGKGWVGGAELITLEFIAAVGQPTSSDTIEIRGTPDITSTIPGGINGDIATCAITVNAIKSVVKAVPGLRTMTDVPVVSFF
jgi:4-hydroxy-tetrahydrodipicolinate reductase